VCACSEREAEGEREGGREAGRERERGERGRGKERERACGQLATLRVFVGVYIVCKEEELSGHADKGCIGRNIDRSN
jgi:hypothetical protein